ncbi:[SSU ribosomal protein S18P]-alanine acetyltransferase [Methanosarcina thermophila]|jgi:ribosomal-protein-alanine N-acetyltransferase|uniref:[SSU ribosomal protein S18P]-alanine acetyltransferase n=3 Tax=Methanosarcina thermophila TaxID=2210 RepID=A0A1I6ZG95_METTE|nr:ribosomal protein S18-alanine N-acetyltransferase [Methanosarcina thermophila]ALK04847.1 MAG: GNAT family acetyltransferase [Methanosarcina sp. 795]AKB13560.1 Ribosomal-protein-S18p-alanine acetyltransferase [Methanosarcina thermophila TM-1]AKB15802.1 Ribosomal-protein-S18p-alanine acetyltransferase [Methanosarcina thermophila CHTI-55]NLU56720.1 ribosomal protein S18-alanine N-acetyltransferase [Methanosarcina thermophila]SFT61601.1 [SSU ribosomal protein S18P]-alanine acetyltransferase [Me
MIRRFAPEDFQEVVEIESEAFSEHNSLLYMSFYETVGDGFLVAELDGKVVGYVVGYRSAENEGHIFSVGVREKYRRRGIGTSLIHAICDIFVANGLRYARLEVRNSNKEAQKLYRSIGFVPCWTEKKYYLDGEDGLVMKMHLHPYRLLISKQKYLEPVLSDDELFVTFRSPISYYP